MNKFFMSLLVATSINISQANDLNKFNNTIKSLRHIEQNLSDLKYEREIDFKSQNAKFLYNKSLRDLRDIIDSLSDSSQPPKFENFRGRAAIILKEELSFAYIDEALKSLPKFVSKNDLKAILVIAQEPQNFVSKNLKSYFKNYSSKPKKNSYKGDAGAYLVKEVMRTYLNECLESIPSFISNDDFLAVKNIVDESSQPKIAKSLKAYFLIK